MLWRNNKVMRNTSEVWLPEGSLGPFPFSVRTMGWTRWMGWLPKQQTPMSTSTMSKAEFAVCEKACCILVCILFKAACLCRCQGQQSILPHKDGKFWPCANIFFIQRCRCIVVAGLCERGNGYNSCIPRLCAGGRISSNKSKRRLAKGLVQAWTCLLCRSN